MIGDSLKIGSWLLAYLMLGKAMFKRFIAFEIVSASGFVFLTYGFTDWLGLEGVSMAHALIYLIYWVMVWHATAPLMKRDVNIAGSDV
ncbi:hypothetical protein D3C81_1913960 [compost metagenome]